MTHPPTVILRHRRENLKKCSLRGLENNPEFHFCTYPQDRLPDLSGYVVLKMDAPLLTLEDAGRGILLIDGTWRLAQVMQTQCNCLEARSLPPCRTAYPRRQTSCPNPSEGLASVEALYLTYRILMRPYAHLLDHYHWKSLFLQLNEFP